MIRAERVHVSLTAKTHAGMTGKNNEDQFAVTAFQLSAENPEPVVLAVLSDGIGGHRGGEIASELAVNRISRSIEKSDGSDPIGAIREAIVAASDEIHQQSEADPEKKGMGATCACAMLIGRRLYAATVGDSRIYLIRGKMIRRLSTDHTWIQEMLEAGVIRPEEVEGHPNAHVIRRYLGSATPPKIDFRLRFSAEETDVQAEANQGIQLLPGDILMLCSDGLTDLVKDAEILEHFLQRNFDTAVSDLIDLANERGGHDNITIVALRIPEPVKVHAASQRKAFPWKLAAAGCAVILLLAAAGVGLTFGWIWLNQPDSTPTAVLSTARPSILPSVQPSLKVSPGMPAADTKGAPTQPSLAPSSLPTIRSNTATPSLVPPTQPPPSATPQPSPTPGPTLTPWPTDTPLPSATPKASDTTAPTPGG